MDNLNIAPNSEVRTINIEIISDVICPWCYVGKKRFELALKQLPFAERIRVTWKPFQLNPNMGKKGMDRREYRTRKFGSWESAQQKDAQLVAAGKPLGIEFNFEKQTRTPNTVDAHRLIWYTQQTDDTAKLAADLHDALFKAYFTDGLDISDIDVLTETGCTAGLDRDSVKAFLNGDEGREEVIAEEDASRKLGINAVPTFVFNDNVLFSGAQDPERIVHALKQAALVDVT